MKTSCLIKEEELKELAYQNVSKQREDELRTHIQECTDCQLRLWNIFENEFNDLLLTNEETERLKKLVSRLVEKTHLEREHSKKGWAILERIIQARPSYLAAADDQTADDKLNKLLREHRFSFVAMCDKTNDDFWRAELIIPLELSDAVILSIRLLDGEGNSIKEGVFNFCGIEKKVEDGKCYISTVEFRENIKKQTISLCKPNGIEMAGRLDLFPEDLEEM